MYCKEKNCKEYIHTYNKKITHLYCYYHGQIETHRLCPECKEYNTFKRMNTKCYSCIQKESHPSSILQFIRKTNVPWLPFLHNRSSSQLLRK